MRVSCFLEILSRTARQDTTRAEVLGCREGLSDFASTAHWQSDGVCGQILSRSEVRTHARTHELVSIRPGILTMGFTHLS